VTSARKHSDRRDAIRKTWGNKNILDSINSNIVFLLGSSSVPHSEPELDNSIMSEVSQYNDIVQEDFIDSYQNLTLKTVAGLKWTAKFCPQAKFLMKTDDDIYVNINRLLEFLEQNHSQSKKLIIGCVKNGPEGAPQPISPSGVSFKPFHPPFTAGAGYVISGDLVEQLYRTSLDVRLVLVEDAFVTGYCARKVGGVTTRHNKGFSCGQLVTDDCDMQHMFTGHKVTPVRMWQIHGKMVEKSC